MISNNDNCFIPLSHPKLDLVKAFRTEKKVYGKKMTVVVTFNHNLYTAQIKSINNEINKCFGNLLVISTKLEDRIGERVARFKNEHYLQHPDPGKCQSIE